MSKINDLIHQFCPNGAIYQRLEEICEFVTDYVSAGSFASLRENVKYVDKNSGYARLIRTADFSNNFDEKNAIYVNEKAYQFLKKSNLTPGQLIICNIGSIGLTFKAPDLGIPITLAPNAITIKTKYNDDFYYHYFLGKQFQDELARISSKGAMPKFNKTQLRAIKVPVPGLEVQNEIARILDNFTGLKAELEARKKQYEYFRNKLLTFDIKEKGKINLSKDFNYYRGDRLKQVDRKPGNIPLVTAGFQNNGIADYISNEVKTYNDSLTIDMFGNVFWRPYRFACDDNIIVLSSEKLTTNTAFYYLSAIIVSIKQGDFHYGNQYRLKDLFNHEVIVPLLEDRTVNYEKIERISSILYKLDMLTSDLVEGIPAEIKARQQQYEFYKNRLLSFKEVSI